MSINYTGIGSNDINFFTEDEFHRLMIREFVEKPEMKYLLNQNRFLYPELNYPSEYALFTLDHWINFVGATRL